MPLRHFHPPTERFRVLDRGLDVLIGMTGTGHFDSSQVFTRIKQILKADSHKHYRRFRRDDHPRQHAQRRHLPTHCQRIPQRNHELEKGQKHGDEPSDNGSTESRLHKDVRVKKQAARD